MLCLILIPNMVGPDSLRLVWRISKADIRGFTILVEPGQQRMPSENSFWQIFHVFVPLRIRRKY
jgi:hypothetical protein